MQRFPELRVYTDGRCPFCWWSRLKALRYDTDQRLDFRDYNDPQIAAETPYKQRELAYQMHVRTPDGRWYGGFDAWLQVVRVLPKLRWMAYIGALRPFHWLGTWLYKAVATNRYRIARSLLRGFNIPEPCDSACEPPSIPAQKISGIR